MQNHVMLDRALMTLDCILNAWCIKLLDLSIFSYCCFHSKIWLSFVEMNQGHEIEIQFVNFDI